MGRSRDLARLVAVERELCREVERLCFAPPVSHVYNPLRYAWPAHEAYLRRYGRPPKRVLFLGMNPGPFGMAQTGVPFGEVALVRGWLRIEAPVGRPPREHPRRPVQGFACRRREVSGRRLWGLLRRRFPRPERFFRSAFVANYCPLLFLEPSGRNRTPDRLPGRERAPLFAACDRALRRRVEVLRPRVVVGIGRFAERRARAALAGCAVQVGHLPHPSPASPAANRGWSRRAGLVLARLGLEA
jgi:single-strand selective monofunctional uracil DNA glycosylase